MNAREAREISAAASAAIVEKDAQETLRRRKLAEEFENALHNKYAREFHSEVLKQIEATARKGLVRNVHVKPSFHNDAAKTICEEVTKLLAADEYTVETKKIFVPAYDQRDHLDEGDYSHPAYHEYTLVVSW